jgi:4-hydroxy-2-oxoheptanedioate aldolase
MAEIPRLNGFVKALASGRPAFSCFMPPEPEMAWQLATSKYDGVVIEAEHRGFDITAIRHAMQYMLNRGQIAQNGVAPQVTPLVRVPTNGIEKAQWHAKQVLDAGAYGVVWPHISSVDEAYAAISACRYPRLPSAERYEPQGMRGDGPAQATRYWGISQQEYYQRADLWPYDPNGELFVVLQMEDTKGIEALDDILTKVKGIGAVLVGLGDLSQELGYPRQEEHPEVLKWFWRVADTCKKHGVPCGHPRVTPDNAPELVARGVKFLMSQPVLSYNTMLKAREALGV